MNSLLKALVSEGALNIDASVLKNKLSKSGFENSSKIVVAKTYPEISKARITRFIQMERRLSR